MKLSFHGADRDVTGSCHLIECAGRRVLIDCGMFQGGRELAEENAADFGFDPAAIDTVLLTHAHLDHCGRLPLLVKRGFRGEIIATAATRELARLVLLDSAHLAEEDAEHGARRSRRRGTQPPAPLYTLVDAMAALDGFGRTAVYGAPLQLGPGLRASFHEAGHILGSASVLLEVTETGRTRRVLYSGDLGNAGRPILRDPAPPEADVVVMESTYGDRRHRSVGDSVAELCAAINATLQRGGNVVIPTFALERTQELLFHLRAATADGRLPAQLPVFLDSPMAISATEVYRRHPECFDAETAALFRNGEDPMRPAGLRMVRDSAGSMAINRIEGGAVILAGAGMCTGGRIRHHLRHNLWRPAASVVFVGFAAQGTLARRIIDGAPRVTIFGEDVPVRAQVHTINGFSAHADQAELLAWHARAGGRERTILVHGEPAAMDKLAGLLAPVPVATPAPGSSLEL
ncbi:MAG: MBL fold metallo-hydrolase [Steroidobacteraceae bacterium]